MQIKEITVIHVTLDIKEYEKPNWLDNVMDELKQKGLYSNPLIVYNPYDRVIYDETKPRNPART